MKRSQREASARGSIHLKRLSLPAVCSTGSCEGADILGEAAAVPADVLFPVYRSVMAWALTPAAEHGGLFPPAAGPVTRRLVEESRVPEELRPALAAVCDLLDDPAGADPSRVAGACLGIGEWAERGGGAPATALRFLQAAGTCSPNDSRIAYRAGYVARSQALWDVAELWFRHASAVSRRVRDWEAHATAYLGLGNSFYRQGRFTAARREHLKALRVGRRHGLRELQGRAYHDLFAVSIELSEPDRAEEYGQAAFRTYGPAHPAVPALAHDLAYFWNTRGLYARALPVFDALLLHFRGGENRLRVLASMGRAAGGTGHRATFMRAWTEASALCAALQDTAAPVSSMLELAHGASALREWEIAEHAAGQAIQLARRRRETDVVAGGEELLEMIRAERLGDTEHSTVGEPGAADMDPFVADLVDSLTTSGRSLVSTP